MSEKVFLFYLSFLYFLGLFVPFKDKRAHRLNKLIDYKNKYYALRDACPDIKFRKVKYILGGWNIGFIINNKYVFKVRKRTDVSDIQRITKEKRITDTFAKVVPFDIPKIDIVYAGPYVFCKYEFIKGKNLTKLPFKTILKYREKWAKQMAEFVFAMHSVDPENLQDLKSGDGDSWGHNDIGNNMIVDMKTMKIVGLIDWEYSGWNFLEMDLKKCTAHSKKLKKAEYDPLIRAEYAKLAGKN